MTTPPPNEANGPSGRPSGAASTSLHGLRTAVLEVAEELAAEASAGARDAGTAAGHGAITLERPPRIDFGDYSTNAALLLAPGLGASPRDFAQHLGLALEARLGPSLERFEIAGPGFLN